MEIRIPRRFWQDHSERDLPAGRLVRSVGGDVILNVTQEERDEILDDARFYADQYGPDCAPKGLIASAKATVRRMEISR